MNEQDTNKANISFFLEDLSIEELEDNNVELEKMMSEFDTECQDLDIPIFTNINTSTSMNVNDELRDLSYFIKKDLYNGNNEYYYNEEYKIKDLLKICQYYGIASSVKAAKCKKQDIVSTIVYFEGQSENYEIVEKRHKMWAFITELLEDTKMKCYLIW
jgi:hypothetical protein